MTSTSKFESLPKELIAHVATFVEALSVLALSRTSKTIRSACWDSLTFKETLKKSQRLNWRDGSMDLEAITAQAGNDPSSWARYAVADDKAWLLATQVKDPLSSRRLSINFLPELALVRHPFLKQNNWFKATHGPFDYLTSHVFSVTMAVLSADNRSLSRFHDPGKCEYCYPKPRENDPAFLSNEGSLWTLCSIAITLRDGLRIRRDVWPYNNEANVPMIDFPRANQIPLRPLNAEYGLPRPFSRPAVQLMSRFPSLFSEWDTWYRQHNRALYKSEDFLTKGSWCGYYTSTASHTMLDPPMTRIRFSRSKAHDDCDNLSADNCLDGVGPFSLRGSIRWDGDVVKVTMQKDYESGIHWDWDCRLTPFGIVGHWGALEDGSLVTYGFLWLWKQEWTEQSTAQRVT